MVDLGKEVRARVRRMDSEFEGEWVLRIRIEVERWVSLKRIENSVNEPDFCHDLLVGRSSNLT